LPHGRANARGAGRRGRTGVLPCHLRCYAFLPMKSSRARAHRPTGSARGIPGAEIRPQPISGPTNSADRLRESSSRRSPTAKLSRPIRCHSAAERRRCRCWCWDIGYGHSRSRGHDFAQHPLPHINGTAERAKRSLKREAGCLPRPFRFRSSSLRQEELTTVLNRAGSSKGPFSTVTSRAGSCISYGLHCRSKRELSERPITLSPHAGARDCLTVGTRDRRRRT
jgi:hypothetical protein